MKRKYWIFAVLLSCLFLAVSFSPVQTGAVFSLDGHMECIPAFHLETETEKDVFTPGVFKIKIETYEPGGFWRLETPPRFWIVAQHFKKGMLNIETWWVLTFAKPAKYDLLVVQSKPLFPPCPPRIHTVFHLTLLRHGRNSWPNPTPPPVPDISPTPEPIIYPSPIPLPSFSPSIYPSPIPIDFPQPSIYPSPIPIISPEPIVYPYPVPITSPTSLIW